jgi:predicted metalloprotease with PDZ domain
MQTPGRLVQTVADSSHSTWIKLYRPDENSVNTTISYYLKGALIGLILDITIRVKSKLKYSLDDLMRKLWKDTKKEDYRGFDFKDIRRYSEELAGSDLGSFFRNHVFSTKEINFKKYFEMAGLSLSAVEEKKPLPYLGLKTVKEPESLYPQVVNVLRGSAADAAGFYSGDILVALNGARVKEISIAGQISDFNVDDEIAVTLFRNGFLKKIQVKLTEKPAFNFAISKGKTRGQKKAMRNMLLASAKGK